MTQPDIIATLRQWYDDFQQKHGQLPPCWLVDSTEYGAAVRWMDSKFTAPRKPDTEPQYNLDGLPFRIVKDGPEARESALYSHPATNPHFLPLPYPADPERTAKIVLKLPQRQRNALVRAACARQMKLSTFMLEAAFEKAEINERKP